MHQFGRRLNAAKAKSNFVEDFGFDPTKLKNGGHQRIDQGSQQVLAILATVANRCQEIAGQSLSARQANRAVGQSAVLLTRLDQAVQQSNDQFFRRLVNDALFFRQELLLVDLPRDPEQFLRFMRNHTHNQTA